MTTATLASAPRPHAFATRPDSSAPRLRITARGRAVLLAITTTPVLVVMAALALNGGGANAGLDAGVPFEHVTVASGQSLWQLAEEVAPAADPREVITAIMQVNQLVSSDVYPGQELALPPQYTR